MNTIQKSDSDSEEELSEEEQIKNIRQMSDTCKLENINYIESVPSGEKGIVYLNHAMPYKRFEHDRNIQDLFLQYETKF